MVRARLAFEALETAPLATARIEIRVSQVEDRPDRGQGSQRLQGSGPGHERE